MCFNVFMHIFMLRKMSTRMSEYFSEKMSDKMPEYYCFIYIYKVVVFFKSGDMANMEQISYMCMLTWNCWLSTKWQLVGLYVNINMTSSQKVPGIKIHQHIPTPTWHLRGTYPAHEF